MFTYKKVILIFVLLFLLSLSLFAEEKNYPIVGVINIKRVAQTFFKDSRALRDIEAKKEQYKEDIDKIIEEIEKLESQILEAKLKNNYDTARMYELEKEKKIEHLREYRRITDQQIEEKLKKAYYSDNFMNKLSDAIDTISLINGYSLILDVNDGNIYFYTPEIDITDKVIEELMRKR